jgi:SAM-dependent methyltransferase
MKTTDPSSSGKSWDTYWRGTGDAGAFSSGGVSHPAIHAFWNDFFGSLQANSVTPRMIDLATGNGAVVEVALGMTGIENAGITCVDSSSAAIENVERRFPGISGIVADALAVPLDDGGFDLATSQFGVEYAGTDAIYEAARLLTTGGQLAMLLHVEGGSVYKECSDNLNAIRRLLKANFIPLATELFKTGFAAVRGADRAPYDAAGLQLAPAVKEAETIMGEFGEHVAGDTIARLYSDVGSIHSQLPDYDPDEVLGWLDTMNDELSDFAGRMSSMTNVAMGQDTFERVCQKLGEKGFTMQRAGPLTPEGQSLPLAWALIASKRQN